MLNSHIRGNIARSSIITIALSSSACATMDADAERVETGVPATAYGVFDPSRYQVNQTQTYMQTQTYVPNPSVNAAAPMAAPAPVSSSNGPSHAPSSDPGVYAGDSGFSPWPGTPTGATGIAATCNGAGNVANAQSVVASMGPGFRRCYNHALQADPKIAGSVRFTVKVGPDGRLISGTPTNVVGLPPTMLVCLGLVIQSKVFAPPCGGAATVVIPVSFVSN